jgi:hypothetical protein
MTTVPVRELMITRRLEAELSKTRILELYLNLIEWGDGIWGCEAAARAYFGVSAADLSAEQAALMAGAIINPRVHSPAHPTPRLRRRSTTGRPSRTPCGHCRRTSGPSSPSWSSTISPSPKPVD